MREAQARQNHPGTDHIPALDGLRGLAILLVLFLHFTILLPENALEAGLVRFSSLGTHGVDLFFVLSGFLVTRILLQAKGSPHYLKNFYMRRVLRIFPLYYTLVLLSFVILPSLFFILPQLGQKLEGLDLSRQDWPWYVFFASNFLSALQNQFSHDILGVSWSLAIEEHFYLVWPWIVLRFGTTGLRRILWVLVGAALVLRCYFWLEGWSPLQIYVVTFTRMDTIAIGALFALELSGRTAPPQVSEKRRLLALFGAATCAMTGFFFAGWFDVATTQLNTFMYTLIAFYFLLLMKIAVYGQTHTWVRTLLANPWIRQIGKYSYAMYLLHMPVRYGVRFFCLNEVQMRSFPGGPLAGQVFFYGVAFAATFGLAALSWHLLEKRFLSLKKRYA